MSSQSETRFFITALLSFFLFILSPLIASAQSDAEKFAEGRVAFDAHHDCRAAWDAFRSVSASGQNNVMWLFYMAKTEECLDRPSEALRYLEQYDRMVPGQAEVINKIGELRYKVRKQREAEMQATLERDTQAREAGRVETAKRQQMEERRARHNDALRTLNSDGLALVKIINNHATKTKAQDLLGCTVKIEDYLDRVSFSFADLVPLSIYEHHLRFRCVDGRCIDRKRRNGPVSGAYEFTVEFGALMPSNGVALANRIISACSDPDLDPDRYR